LIWIYPDVLVHVLTVVQNQCRETFPSITIRIFRHGTKYFTRIFTSIYSNLLVINSNNCLTAGLFSTSLYSTVFWPDITRCVTTMRSTNLDLTYLLTYLMQSPVHCRDHKVNKTQIVNLSADWKTIAGASENKACANRSRIGVSVN